jgi:hypothetical protein
MADTMLKKNIPVLFAIWLMSLIFSSIYEAQDITVN